MHAITRGVVGRRRDLEKVLCTAERFLTADTMPESLNTHPESTLSKTGARTQAVVESSVDLTTCSVREWTESSNRFISNHPPFATPFCLQLSLG